MGRKEDKVVNKSYTDTRLPRCGAVQVAVPGKAAWLLTGNINCVPGGADWYVALMLPCMPDQSALHLHST